MAQGTDDGSNSTPMPQMRRAEVLTSAAVIHRLARLLGIAGSA